MQRTAALTLFLLYLGTAPSIAAPPRYEQGFYGKTLHFSVTSDPKTFNPILAQEVSSTDITNMLFAALIDIDPRTFDLGPGLIERWSMLEQGRIWEVSLRPGLRWSDGQPLTTSDLAFTFNKIYTQPKLNLEQSVLIFQKPVRLEVLDTLTARFHLPDRFGDFLSYLNNLEILPAHLLDKPAVLDAFENCYTTTTPPAALIGSGPFVLAEYVPGSHLKLKRNPYYYKRDDYGNQLPYLDGVQVHLTSDQDLALLKFTTRELHVFGLRGGDLRGLSYDILRKRQPGADFTIREAGHSFGSFFVVFNQNLDLANAVGTSKTRQRKIGWFRDVNFRRAIAHAIDKRRIITEVMNGLAVEQHGPLSPSLRSYYFDAVPRYPYDLEKARKLLEKAGFRPEKPHGKLRDSQGNPLEFDLHTSIHRQDNIKICGIIREDLERLGLTVNFTPKEFNAVVTSLTQTSDYDAILVGLTGSRDPYTSRQVWMSSGRMHMWYPLQGKPSTSWEKEIDDIFEQAMREVDQRRRRELYNRWQVLAAEYLPFIFTVIPDFLSAGWNDLGNFDPLPTPFSNALHNLDYIYLKPQKPAAQSTPAQPGPAKP